jgi:hypothetical protein
MTSIDIETLRTIAALARVYESTAELSTDGIVFVREVGTLKVTRTVTYGAIAGARFTSRLVEAELRALVVSGSVVV